VLRRRPVDCVFAPESSLGADRVSNWGAFQGTSLVQDWLRRSLMGNGPVLRGTSPNIPCEPLSDEPCMYY
jgi:hypothetical protein